MTLPMAVCKGGLGTDTLRIDGSAITLDLSGLSGTVLSDLEKINLTGSGNNTLNVTATQVLALSSTTDTLIVDGNVGDALNAGAGWSDLGVIGSYHHYSQASAILQVDTDITQNIFP
jgi:hypothetical protein